MQQTAGNATQAAKLLGISFRSMRYRLKKLGIREKD
jgi:two-component system response regulator PilR (NtrC family)